MKSLEQIAIMYKSNNIDGRNLSRLANFIPEDMLPRFGIELKDEHVGKHVAAEFTRDNVLKQLAQDVEFGFNKALDQRGISSSLMHDVVCMWNWILEEGLEEFDDYPKYGLPLFKATAVKYGFDNPIGDDDGTESKYACEE